MVDRYKHGGMKLFTLTVVILLVSCNNSADTTENKKDSLDSVAHAQKNIIDSAANEARKKVDSIEKQGKEMIDSTTAVRKEELQKEDSLKRKK